MSTDDLKQKAVQLSYPPKDDGKGSARVNWRRQAYYFGKHNTPESFQLFCEWRKQLVDTGEAPAVRTIRRDLAHTMQEPNASPPPPTRTLAMGLAVSVFLTATVTFAIARIFSSSGPQLVDGRPLSESEQSLVQGYRSRQDAMIARASDHAYKLGVITAEIREEDPLKWEIPPHERLIAKYAAELPLRPVRPSQ